MSPVEIAIVINQAAAKHGVSPEALMAIADIESTGNVNAQNPRSSASGLFQFVDSTAREYGLTGSKRNDPVAQADAAAKMMAMNQRSLERSLGRPVSPGELYLAHQQGLTGARALLTNPGRPAVDVLTDVYGSRDRAAKAVALNGGNLNQSAGQFAGQWVNKANQRTALVPPGEIHNVVASQLDTTPQTRDVPRPQPRPQRQNLMDMVRPRLTADGSNIYSYQPEMTPTSVTRGLGSLTPNAAQETRPSAIPQGAMLPNTAPVPLPRPRPSMGSDPSGGMGTTIATIPTTPQAPQAPQRLPRLDVARPQTYVERNAPNMVSTSMQRAAAARDPELQDALARRVSSPGMVDTSMQRAQAAVDPGLQRALVSRNTNDIGQMPEFAEVLSQFGPVATASIPGPNAPPKDQARLMPGVRNITPVASNLPPVAPIQVVPAVATQTATARPVVGFPTPANQRPAQMQQARRTIGFPTPANLRPSMAMVQPQQPALRVTVNGAGSYNAQPQPTREEILAAIRERSRGPAAFGGGGIIDGAVQPVGTLTGRR